VLQLHVTHAQLSLDRIDEELKKVIAAACSIHGHVPVGFSHVMFCRRA
jgi:hypothetical protein